MRSLGKYLSVMAAMFVSVATIAQTTPVPPDKVPQTDGTIQLVPKPPASVFTPYFIDPTVQYQLYLTSGWAQVGWDGRTKNGQYGFKGSIITADILLMPYTTKKTLPAPDGRTIAMFSIYRSTDAIVQYDHTRLELLPYSASANGPAFDTKVMNGAKTQYTVLGDGLVQFHGEALPVPEARTPPAAAQYYQWNFGGYMWQGGYRLLGKLQFRVKDDYYAPTWGAQRSFIRLLPSVTVGEKTFTTSVNGSPTTGTNVLKDIRSEGEQIMFGAPADYKVSHFLTAPETKFKIGDTVSVQVRVKTDTKPQIISYVATNFIWDNTKLEFMGINNTGARRAQSSRMDLPGAGRINEASVPKDGNAFHNWLSLLGDRSYLDGEALIVTLNFKVISDFDTTQVEIVKQNDPRLVGLWVPEESSIGGSNIPGSIILGTQTPSVKVNGIFAQ